MVKKVAVISDLSGLGKCSLTVALPIISVLGVQPCPFPTSILSNQTGYPTYFLYDFTENMPSISSEWKKLGFQFNGIYSGFLSSVEQVDIIKKFVEDFKKEDTIFIVDPIMGDDGEAYPNFSKEMQNAIKELACKADILTPNITECCMLTETDYKVLMSKKEDEDFILEVAKISKQLIKGNVKKAVVTGIKHKGKDDDVEMFYNIVIDNEEVGIVKSSAIGTSYSGTGDILTSILCAMCVNGKSIKEAVEVATKFISKAVEDTAKEGTDRNHGVNFEKFLYMLIDREN